LTKYFPISVGLHQGSALSPYLFALVMDVLARHLQEVYLGVGFLLMIFFLLIRLERELKVNMNYGGQSKCFYLSRSQTEYMECNLSNNKSSVGIVTLGDQVIS